MKARSLLPGLAVALLVVISGVFLAIFGSRKALAASEQWVAGRLQDASGGMAQYGSAVLNSTSESADLSALTNWNSYINARCGWSLSSSDLSRLANADWNARQAGSPQITPQQLASAATAIINSTLSTMSASQQQALLNESTAISVPDGIYGMNAPDPNVSVSENSNGAWTVAVGANDFSQRKAFFQTYAPGMVTSSSNFYPDEAIIVTYSLAAGDLGYDNSYISGVTQFVENQTGSYVQLLYGTDGYLIRRPLSTFLTEANIGQFFSDLGF